MCLVVAGGSDGDRYAHRSVACRIRGARLRRDYRMLLTTVSFWRGAGRQPGTVPDVPMPAAATGALASPDAPWDSLGL
jgi:hypothetical protein